MTANELFRISNQSHGTRRLGPRRNNSGTSNGTAALTSAVGFHYQRDAASGQMAHAAGIMMTTREGRLSLATILGLAAFMTTLIRRERRRSSRSC